MHLILLHFLNFLLNGPIINDVGLHSQVWFVHCRRFSEKAVARVGLQMRTSETVCCKKTEDFWKL